MKYALSHLHQPQHLLQCNHTTITIAFNKSEIKLFPYLLLFFWYLITIFFHRLFNCLTFCMCAYRSKNWRTTTITWKIVHMTFNSSKNIFNGSSLCALRTIYYLCETNLSDEINVPVSVHNIDNWHNSRFSIILRHFASDQKYDFHERNLKMYEEIYYFSLSWCDDSLSTYVNKT